MDDIVVIDALPAHEPLIRAHSDTTYEAHHSRLPRAFGDDNSYQHRLLDVAFMAASEGLSDFRCKLLVAVSGDTLMGYILIIWNAPDDELLTSAVIADIGVLPEYERRGVGQTLLTHAKSLMPDLSWQSLTADVWLNNTASHKLFATAGFAAERTEYRYGEPPLAREKSELPKTPSLSREHMLILLALAAALLIYLSS